MLKRKNKWRVFAQHECLFLVGPCYIGDYIIPAMGMEKCPKCGEPCGLEQRDTWARVTRRRVSDAQWHKPWTWRSFHWEYNELGHMADGGYSYRAAMRNSRADSKEN